MKRVQAFVLGASTAYFLDPDSGARRRRMVADRTARITRRTLRLLGKKARYAEGRLYGATAGVQDAVTPDDERATDDATVLQRIRSEALRDVGLSTKGMEIDVRDGVVTVEGTVPSASLGDDLVARVREVPGVEDVHARISVALHEAAAETGDGPDDVRLT